MELIESYREVLSGLLDIYISSVSNKMNEVMKVLTVFASIFIPLTFLAGIYGMNFEYMPELKWKWAYPALWIVFIQFQLYCLSISKKRNGYNRLVYVVDDISLGSFPVAIIVKIDLTSRCARSPQKEAGAT